MVSNKYSDTDKTIYESNHSESRIEEGNMYFHFNIQLYNHKLTHLQFALGYCRIFIQNRMKSIYCVA